MGFLAFLVNDLQGQLAGPGLPCLSAPLRLWATWTYDGTGGDA